MANLPSPSLFSRYGQRRLGAELLTYLRAAEAAGDADASAELGSAYLDANGVDFDLDRALQHLDKGAKAGNRFCQFRIAEHWLQSELKDNPHSDSSHRQNYDRILACAKAGVGEAYVTLHHLHLGFRQHPMGYPKWIRPEAESSIALFLTTLRTCYEYQDGGSADRCVNALEMLARDGFTPAYWTASIVAAVGCKDMARSRANLVAAVENGVREAVDHFVEHSDDIVSPSLRANLLSIAAEYGHAKAWYLCQTEKKSGGQPEEASRAEFVKFLRSSPRWFGDESLTALEFVCQESRTLADVPEARAEIERLVRILASLGRPNSATRLHASRLEAKKDIFFHYDQLDVADQMELAKDIGRIFVAALNGSSDAWRTMMLAHLSGALTGHAGIGRKGPHAQQSATAGLLSGLVAEELTGKPCVPDFIRDSFVTEGVRGVPANFKQHALKEVAQITRHRAYAGLMQRYGLGYMPASRLLHECEYRNTGGSSGTHPWQLTPLSLGPNWPASPATRPIKVSRNPFAKGWIHPKGIDDPLCQAMRRHLDAGELPAAKRCLRFDEDLIPRLLTLAAGLYESGYKLECSDLLAFGAFDMRGQAGLSHHMLAWVYHEIGRTNDAIRIAHDSFEACECKKTSDADLAEYNLLLAEMLMSVNRRDEAQSVVLKLKAYAANDQVTKDRCEQVLTMDYPDPLAWFAVNKLGEMYVHFDHRNKDIRTNSLTLTNMDRYRSISTAHRRPPA